MVLQDTFGRCLSWVSEIPGSLRDKIRIPACISKTNMREKKSSVKSGRLQRTVYWSIVSLITVFFLSQQTVYAADIWSTFSDMMKDVYTKLLGISTIVGVTAAAVALLIRMISRNQRAVDEASSWLKRIIVTWVVLNSLGFIVAYIQPLVAGGQYTP